MLRLLLTGNTERQGADIKQQQVGSLGRGSLARQDTSLDSSTVCNGLVGVDVLLELLSAKEVAEQLLNLGDTCGATDQDNLVDLVLVDTRVLENLLDWLHGGAEEVFAESFEFGTCDGHVHVNTVNQRVDLDGSLRSVGQSALGSLTGGA